MMINQDRFSILQVYANPQPGMLLDERLAYLRRLRVVNDSFDKVLKGDLDFMDFLDIAENLGVDVDDYLDSFDHNLLTAFNVDIDSITPNYFYVSG